MIKGTRSGYRIGKAVDAWGFAPPGPVDSTGFGFPGPNGNYTNGQTSSLLGMSAKLPAGRERSASDGSRHPVRL